MDTIKLSEVIRKRRSIFPPMYTDELITKEEIVVILENGNWAPTHRKTEPWRYKIIMGDSLVRLHQFLEEQEDSLLEDGKASPLKIKKLKQKILQSSCIIAICMYNDPKVDIPEWEEIAAVACSVQNMWLTCTTMDIGSYWSSPKSFFDPFIGLEENEKSLGFFYMGKKMDLEIKSNRKPMESKVKWL